MIEMKNKDKIKNIIKQTYSHYIDYEIIYHQARTLDSVIDYEKTKENQILRIVEDEATHIVIALDTINMLLQHKVQLKENLLSSMKSLISALATQDPNKLHYNNVRSEIEEIKKETIVQGKKKGWNNKTLINALENSITVDQLARSLVEFCKALKIKFSQTSNDEIESDQMFIWDKICLDVLDSYGKEGKKAKEQLRPYCQSIFEEFKAKGFYSYNMWIDLSSSPETPTYLSKFLKIFVSVFWEEKIKPKVNYAANNPAGTTTNVTPSLSKILSPRNTIKKTSNDELQLYDKNTFLGNVKIAAVDSRMLERLMEDGIKYLSSLSAVKLIRHFIKETHEQYVKGNPNYSSLEFPGRGQQVAKCLGLKSGKDVTTINALILLFDNLKFTLPGITSRLISVADCMPNSRYSTKGGWLITVLPPLMPNYIFTDKGCFIIPLLNEPPLIGPNQYHARQYILQWKITEEFSKQSADLARSGWITITKKMWDEWLYTVEIPEKYFHELHKAITGVNGYLEVIDTDCYSLKNEERSLKFLKAQGRRRLSGSKGGKTGTCNRYKKRPKPKKLIDSGF
jgi:hypothetical protein